VIFQQQHVSPQFTKFTAGKKTLSTNRQSIAVICIKQFAKN